MELDLSYLIVLLNPMQCDYQSPHHHRVLIEKCRLLNREMDRLQRIADKYKELPEREFQTRMMIGRRIIILEHKCLELEKILDKIHYGDVGVEWPSAFERDFCEGIASHIVSI